MAGVKSINSHVDHQHRIPPVAVPDQVQEILGVWSGDVQRVDHIEDRLEEGRERKRDHRHPLEGLMA